MGYIEFITAVRARRGRIPEAFHFEAVMNISYRQEQPYYSHQII